MSFTCTEFECFGKTTKGAAFFEEVKCILATLDPILAT